MSKKQDLQKQLFESQLGSTLYQFGTFSKVRIHEKGISHTKNNITISWNDIDALYYYPVRHVTYFYFIPVDERRDATFSVVDKNKNIIRFTVKNTIEDAVYKLFIENIFTRQWEEFVSLLNNNGTMIFGTLAISLQVIGEAYISKNGSYEFKNAINLQRINGYNIKSGKVYIEYIDEKGKPKKRCYGEIGSMPNFLIAHTFLQSHISTKAIIPNKEIIS